MGCTARARPALTPAQPQQALPRARDEEHGRREERIQQRARSFPGFCFPWLFVSGWPDVPLRVP